MASEASPVGATSTIERLEQQNAKPWVTVVWDDPVNLMSYVTHVFCEYFKYSKEKAESLMLEVHNNGKAVVSHGGREAMETDVIAMHGYGLQASLEQV